MKSLRRFKDSYIVQMRVAYSRIFNPFMESDGASGVRILSGSVCMPDGEKLKRIIDEKIDSELVRLREQHPDIKYEKSLVCPLKISSDGNIWTLKAKLRCYKKDKPSDIMTPIVPIFTDTCNKVMNFERANREIAANSVVNLVFRPMVYTYDDWGVVTAGITLKLEAVQIVKEESATASSGNNLPVTAADFGLEVSSEEDEFEIFPGLKL